LGEIQAFDEDWAGGLTNAGDGFEKVFFDPVCRIINDFMNCGRKACCDARVSQRINHD
jgi:hypothetical protein